MLAVQESLVSSRLFRTVPPDAVARLVPWFRVREVGSGVTLVQEGQPAGALFIVAKGGLVVCKSLDRKAEALVTRLGPGHHVGEVDLIDAQMASASVASEVPTTLLVLDQRRLREMLVMDRVLFTHVARALFVDLSERIRNTNDRVRDAIAWGLDATGQSES